MASKRAAAGDNARVRAVLDEWLGALPSTNTRAAYRSDVETFGRWCAATGSVALTADTATLIAFQNARQAVGDSDSTMRRRWSALSSFYDFATSSGHAEVNPVKGIDRPKVASGDPSSTARLSVQAVASYQAMAAALDPRLDALVALLVTEGLKVGEALALDVTDISRRSTQTSICVRRRGTVNRIVVAADTAKALRRCVGKRPDGPVFTSERSRTAAVPRRLTRFGADHLIRQLRNSDDADPVTANALRRFHFTRHDADDVSLDDLRESGGLADVRGVLRYTSSNAADDSLDDRGETAREAPARVARRRRSGSGKDTT